MINKRKQQIIDNFDPNGIGVENGNFIGLPFDFDTADIILFPVPWDVTVSYRDGTHLAPENILNASYQLDLINALSPDTWKKGIYFNPVNHNIKAKNRKYRKKAEQHIRLLEQQKKGDFLVLKKINKACKKLNKHVYLNTKRILEKNKKIILIGGDHSTPFGYYKSLSEKFDSFGILQIDAHCDLRKSYEGFKYSHASIFHNALKKIKNISHLIQVGIRDYCEEEWNYSKSHHKIKTFTDFDFRKKTLAGSTFQKNIEEVINSLPNNIYISFDVDGLSPDLCPETGTPVPGGFNFNEIIFIFNKIKESNKNVIGCDLCEVSGKNNWDANVGARIIYLMAELL